jgi:predicted secreted acid phosphatase
MSLKYSDKDTEEKKWEHQTTDKEKVFLVDIDGTVCDDIPNEEPERFATAKPYPDAQHILKEWKEAGHQIHFFTARREEHREVTEAWLSENGFEYDSLVMNKPRIKDGQEYCWVDNKKVRAVTYLGKFSKLVEKEKKILVFDEPQND